MLAWSCSERHCQVLEEATEQRKTEDAQYKHLIMRNKNAKEVLLWSKNRLNKIYNSKLYESAPVAVQAQTLGLCRSLHIHRGLQRHHLHLRDLVPTAKRQRKVHEFL